MKWLGGRSPGEEAASFHGQVDEGKIASAASAEITTPNKRLGKKKIVGEFSRGRASTQDTACYSKKRERENGQSISRWGGEDSLRI